ncbi:MAG: Ig-like domain-containing protein [Bacteroidales bacterium]|nr:Ig-like domain-containing protein [Bacteroidales bacterium]
MNLSSDIADPYIYVSYTGTTLTGTDGSKASTFEDQQVTNKVTSMEPYPIARYTDVIGAKVYVQWSKDVKLASAAASDFTVYVNGTAVSKTPKLSYFTDEEGIQDKTVLALDFGESLLSSSADVITISYTGGLTSLTGTKKAKAFTKAVVQNFYMSESCLEMYVTGGAETGTWDCMVANIPMETDFASATGGKAMYLKTPGDYQRLIFTPNTANKAEWNTNLADPNSRLTGRFYLKSLGAGADGMAIFLMTEDLNTPDYSPKNAAFLLDDITVGKWYEFDIPLGTTAAWSWQAYSEQNKYNKVWIAPYKASSTSEQADVAFEIYIDEFSLCPKKQIVAAESGKVAFDGSQVELNFSTAMKLPTSLSAIVIKEGSTSHAVTSIETKTGDASTLIFNLETPIKSASATITATLAAETSDVKSNDGRKSAPFSVELANLVGCTTSTGWYDDFADATDYVTENLNIGSFEDGVTYSIIENAKNGTLDFTQDGGESWGSQIILAPYSAATNEGFVLDLSGDRGVIEFSVTSDARATVYYRIDVKDYFGNSKDGSFTRLTVSSTPTKVTYNPSFSGVDLAALCIIQYNFIKAEGTEKNDYVPTLYNGTLHFDYISVGQPLYLSDFSPAEVLNTKVGIDEDSKFKVTSSADGYIFVVRGTVNPQYSAMMAAVNAGEGTYTACTANTPATVDMMGMGYGYFKAYAYDPVSGSVSSAYGCQVKDVTPPEFTEYFNEDYIDADGTLFFTVNEDATVYLMPCSSAKTDIDEAPYMWMVEGGQPVTFNFETLYEGKVIKPGDQFYLVAADGSGNYSEKVPASCFEVNQVALDFTVDAAEYTLGDIIKVTATREATVYLVPSDESVRIKTVASKAVLSLASNVYGVAQLETEDLNIDTATTYYIYIVSADGTEMAGPSQLITITPASYELNSISLDVEAVSVKVGCEPTTVPVTFDEPKYPNKALSFSGASDIVTVTYDEKTAVISLEGIAAGTGTITITSDADPTVKATLAVTSVLVPAEIEITGVEKMSPSETQTLTATILPEGATTEITWKSSNTSVATVSSIGVVKAVALGTATITATAKTKGCGDYAVGSFDITVKEAGLNSIALFGGDGAILKADATSTVMMDVVDDDDYNWLDPDDEDANYVTFGVTFQPSSFAFTGVTVASSNTDVATVGPVSKQQVQKTSVYAFDVIFKGGEGVAVITVTAKDDPTVKATITVKNGDAPCTAVAPTAKDITATPCDDITLTATASGTAVWYEVATAGTPLASAKIGQKAAGTYTYYVANNDGVCESARTAVKVTVTAVAAPTAAEAPAIKATADDNVTLSAKLTSGTAAWYTAATGGSPIATALGQLEEGTYTYYVARKDAKGCESERTAVTVTISAGACKTAAPTAKEVPSVTVCEGDPVVLAATFTGTATAVWYAAAEGGVALKEGNSFTTTDTKAGEYTYYVAKNDGCESETRTAVKATITAKPTAIIASTVESEYCSSVETVALSATPATGSWSGTGVTGSTFSPKTAGAGVATITYTIGDPGCQSEITKTITVKAAPSIDLSAIATSACAGEEITLAPATGTWTGTGVEGATFKSETAGSYELAYSETANGCSATDNVTITVTKATAPTATSAIVGLGDAAPALSATGKGTINWYESEAGVSVATGATYTPAITTDAKATYTYYVTNTDGSCESAKVPVTVTVTDCTVPAPTIAAVDEICEGETATLSATGTNIKWYNVSEEGTPLAEGATFDVTTAGTYYASQETTCESARASVVVTVKAKPAAPTATGASSCAGAELVAMTTVESANWYADKDAAALATDSKSFTPKSIAATTTYYVNQVVAGCASDFAEVVYTVKETPAAPVATSATACMGEESKYVLSATGAGLQWFDAAGSPLGTGASQAVAVTTAKDYAYTVTQTVDGCTSEAATATLTVSALPTPTIAIAEEFCSSSVVEVALSATPAGGDFTLDGKAATSFVPSALSEGTHTVAYSYTDANGCAGKATDVTFEVKDCSDPAVTSVKLNVSTVGLVQGDTYNKFTVTILPTEGVDNKGLVWSSSDESVVTVDANGVLTAVAPGTATITVESAYTAGITATCTVNVTKQIVPVSAATIALGDYTVGESGTLDLSEFLTFEPDDASIASIVWSTASSYVTVDPETGIVSGKTTSQNRDNIRITATITSLDGKKVTASTTIKLLKDPTYVSSISIPKTLSLEENSSYTFAATVLPANADDKTVTWAVIGSGATINATTGKLTVTGKAGNSFIVVATAADAEGVESNECEVTIVEETIEVSKITASISAVEVTAGDTKGSTITISYSPANTTQTDYTLFASTSCFSYTDNGDGSFTVIGNQGGTATLTIRSASNPSISTEITVTVIEKVKNITISGSQMLNVGDVAQLSAVAGEATATDKTVTWSSNDPSIATVSETGYVTAKGAGMVQITATAKDGSGVSNSIYITVASIPVQSITVSNVELELGQSAKIKATIAPSNATYKNLIYEVNDNSIISVDGDGNITSLAEGTAIVTVTAPADGVSQTLTVTVTPVKADKSFLNQLIENEKWGAYAVYYKVQDGEIVIGRGKGEKSPLVYNDFQNAWLNAQDVYDEPFATQDQVDDAARWLYDAIKAMGADIDIEPLPDAVDDVIVVNAAVYPTMVTTNVTIAADNLTAVKIVSATGKVVAYEQASGDEIEIDATSFAQGVYKVIVETENGVAVKGFIK